MESLNLVIFDETLRDGEQQVGLFLTGETKYQLARLIAQTGVPHIALMPAVHPMEEQLVKTLVEEGFQSQLIASTLLTRSSIDQSKACGVPQIILFHAVSDRLLFLRNPDLAAHPHYRDKTIDDDIPPEVIQRIRQQMLATVLDHLHYAHQQGLQICFAAEDASRADFHFLVDCINTFAPYLDHVLLCDTVGALTPEKTFVWIHDLLAYTQGIPLGVHFHNDMGLALENTIQAVRAGASGISGTFGGIGERAGNAPLEQVLNGLRLRFGWEVAGIHYEALEPIAQFLNHHGLRPHPPYSQAAQRHESGIHVSAMRRDRQSYSIFPYATPEIWFGKCSGVSNLQYLFEQHLQQPLSRDQYEALRTFIKTLALEQQRSFSMDTLLEWIERGDLPHPFESLNSTDPLG